MPKSFRPIHKSKQVPRYGRKSLNEVILSKIGSKIRASMPNLLGNEFVLVDLYPSSKEAKQNVVAKGGKSVKKIDIKAFLIKKDKLEAVGLGSNNLVLPIGEFQLSPNKKTNLALKFVVAKKEHLRPEIEKNNFVIIESNRHEKSETNNRFFSDLNFPTVFMHEIKVNGVTALLTENLKTPQTTIHDAENFNFNSIKNGVKLKESLGHFIDIMKNMYEEKAITPTHFNHKTGTLMDAAKAFKRCFFIVENNESKEAHLVMGDLDHIDLNISHEKINPKIRDEIVNTILRKRNL